ncbi:MAG TPA: hypothetical protein VHP38_02510 [Ruminiclostridium sp.]|nr:hypothetical protein [Ruminiclostridium sp.]
MENIARCKRCLMPEERGGQRIKLNEDGLCSACARETANTESIDWEARRRNFESILEDIRGKGDYDGLIMLSGGKDSVYSAYLLSKVYKLKLMALTIDNSFEYPETFENSKKTARQLNIPLINYQLEPEKMREYYKFLLTDDSIKRKDTSQLCFFCGRYLKYLAADIAVRFNIPAVFSGHNMEQVQGLGDESGLGQVEQVRKRYINAQSKVYYKAACDSLEKSGNTSILPLFTNNLGTTAFNNFIYPLQYFEYKPQEIINIIKRELGWQPIKRFSEKYISSGCRVAKVLQYVAKTNNTVTYVDVEFSDQIRNGSLKKEDVEAFYATKVEDRGELENILEELGLKGREKLLF